MSSAGVNIFYVIEPLAMAMALFYLWRSKQGKRFPALAVYLALRLSTSVLLQAILTLRRSPYISNVAAYSLYFWFYWSTYLVGAVMVFFVLHELFNRAMEPLPGLKRLGSITFRWITCVSMVAALATSISPGIPRSRFLLGASDQIMRCQSIFMLCLLLFLMLAAGKLGLSYGSRIFGISFGFGILGASNLITSAVMMNLGHNMWTSRISMMDTGAGVLAFAVWSFYFARSEPARKVSRVPLASPLVRWNEIAASLGGQPAAAAGDFFLQDVEKVVDRVLVKNSLNAAS